MISVTKKNAREISDKIEGLVLRLWKKEETVFPSGEDY